MEAKELFEKLQNDSDLSTLMQLKHLFFQHKSENLKNNKKIAIYRCKKMVKKIKNQFPEAELFYDEDKDLRLIRLQNADFLINYSNSIIPICDIYTKLLGTCRKFTIIQGIAYQRIIISRNDIIDFMIKINKVLPVWQSEFKDFCKTYSPQIEKFELKRLMYGNHPNIIEKYVNGKINDFLLMKRSIPSYYTLYKNHSRQWLINNIGQQLKNSNISSYSIFTLQISLPIKDAALFTLDFRYLPFVIQIDEQIPLWLEEARLLQHEYLKKKKQNKISENISDILINNTMKKMGYEYMYAEDTGILEIRLKKTRTLELKIPVLHPEKVKTMLEKIPLYIDSINNLPMNAKIYNPQVQEKDI